MFSHIKIYDLWWFFFKSLHLSCFWFHQNYLTPNSLTIIIAKHFLPLTESSKGRGMSIHLEHKMRHAKTRGVLEPTCTGSWSPSYMSFPTPSQCYHVVARNGQLVNIPRKFSNTTSRIFIFYLIFFPLRQFTSTTVHIYNVILLVVPN